MDLTPVPASNDIQANTYTNNTQGYSAITALSGGGFLVTWMSITQDTNGWGIYGRRYNAAGVAQGGEIPISLNNSDQEYPAIAALLDGGFVVTWMSYQQDGSDYGIYGRRFDASGSAVTGEFPINTTTAGEQYFSSITATADGGFVVTWMSLGQDGNGWGIYGRRYDASGAAQGGEIAISTGNFDQQTASVTGLPGGGFVVTWMSYLQDGSGWGIYGRRFDASGAAVTGEFLVNSTTVSDQLYPSITALADGGFVVTWMSYLQDGNGYGIYGRRYNSAGVAQGGEIAISTGNFDQLFSSVTALSDGGFVAKSMSNGQDGSGFGIYGRRFDASGVAVSGEFLINQQTTGDQYAYQFWGNTTIDQLANGQLVATWTDYNSTSGDVIVRLLDVPSAVPVPTPGDDTFIGSAGDDTINLLAGVDTYSGGNGADIITGGPDADNLSGDAGNDRFIAAAGDLVAGETVNGGADTDALELLGGSHSLVGVTLTSIEQIKLTGTAATTVTLASASQALLFTSSSGSDDSVIFNGDLTAPQLAALAAAGIEHVHTKSGVLDVTRNYIGGVLQEVITQDPTNAFPFLISTDTRDASGATTSIHTVFDNGVDETILFAGGIKTSTTKLDKLDAFDWFSQEFTYSPNGTTLASVLNTANNGDTTLTTYGATSNTTVFTDVSNTSPLASRSQTTGTDGKPTSSTFTYDDGRVDTRTYTAGILTRFEEVDVNNVVPDYKTNVVEYDATGVETRQLLTRDNLDTYEILHSGGVLTQTTRGDGSHSAAYDRFTIDFAGGTYTKATTIYDNQLRTERTYSPQGAVTSYFQSDDADVFTYDRLAITYKADGSIATQVITLDNGHKDVLNNVDGGTLVGGSFNDTLIGHLGMDTFAFGPGGGNDYVSNFQNGIDKLDLSAFGLPDFAAVKSHAVANGANGIYMTFANGEHLAVNGLSLANFDATDVKVV